MTSPFASDVAASLGGDVSADEVERVLARARVRPSSAVPVPRRLKLTRLRFTGIKSFSQASQDLNAAPDGPVQMELTEEEVPGISFDFAWEFESGLYGIGSFKNFRGKSSVLEIILWALRGRCHLQADIRAWLRTVQLDFGVGDERLTVAFEVRAGVPYGEVRSGTVVLAVFKTHGEFEASMDDVMMPRLGLTAIPAWQGVPGGEEEDGQAVNHSWVTYAGALFITHRSLDNLLGDTSYSGLPGRLLLMFVGVPWASTMVEAQVSAKAIQAELAAVRRRASADSHARSRDRSTLEDDLQQAREYLTRLPDTADNLRELSAAMDSVNVHAAEVARLQRLLYETQGARDTASSALRAEEARRLSVLEDTLARRFFNSFEPTVCPRCTSPVTEDRRAREHDSHMCSVCATGLDLEALANDVILAQDAPDIERDVVHAAASLAGGTHPDDDAESPVDELNALREALDSAERRLATLSKELRNAQELLEDANLRVTAAHSADALLGARRRAELDIARLEGALDQVARVEGRTDDSTEQRLERRWRILTAAEKLARQRVQAEQKHLLDKVGEEILRLGHQFGIEALEAVTLRGNATLTVHKGGQKVAYGGCTRGEMLRLKVATAVALLRVGFTSGAGRHPGLLLVDSPGAEEAASADIDAMLHALLNITSDIPNLQILVATRSPDLLSQLLGEKRRKIAPPDGYVW